LIRFKHAAIWQTILALCSLYPFTHPVNGGYSFIALYACAVTITFFHHNPICPYPFLHPVLTEAKKISAPLDERLIFQSSLHLCGLFAHAFSKYRK
jgi:hypothetical protein